MIKLLSSLSIPTDFSKEQKLRIEANRIDLLYKQSPMGILGTMACTVILAYLLRHLISGPYLISWICLALISSLLRSLLVYRYFHLKKTPDNIKRWGWWNVISLCFAGLVWGAASAMIFPVTSLPHQFFLTLVLCGLVAGASMAFAVMLRAFLIFSVPAIFTLVVRMLTMQSDMHLFVGILAIIYWMLSFLIAVNIRKTRLQLLTLKEELADRVSRRTADLEAANARLRTEIQQRIDAQEERQQMYTKLEKARKLEAIATLAGGMAHQFNNALSVIVGTMELMKQEFGRSNKIRQYVSYITKTVERMTQLTNQLLAYAQGGKYKPRPADITHIIETTLALTKHTFLPSIEVIIEVESNLPKVLADATQMQMGISAIVANACEAMETGGRLFITGRVKSIGAQESSHYGNVAAGEYVEITITDSGVGMDVEILNRIFEPFFSTKFQGRGLAMAAVYGIIKSHEGNVEVTSQKGKGTQVTILLPAIETIDPEVSTQSQASEPIKGSGTVLLIEDEEMVMEVNKAMLASFGYKVVCASTGKAALALIRNGSKPIDLVWLDLKLPDMDGASIFPVIRKHRPHSRIILSSGYALDESAQELMDAGANGFIQKPFSVNAMAELLNDVMAKTP